MRYSVPLRIIVDVDSEANVVAAARAELQRQFDFSDEQLKERERPADKRLAEALGIMLTSAAVTGSVTGILERTVPGLSVSGMHVWDSEVVALTDG